MDMASPATRAQHERGAWSRTLQGASALPRWWVTGPRPVLSSEALVVWASLVFTFAYNTAFWHAALAGPGTHWQLACSLLVVVVAAHIILLGLLLPGPGAKPLLCLLLLATALASHYMNVYGVYIDADMLRNVLHTDRQESAELASPDLLPPLGLALAGCALVSRVRLRQRTLRRAVAARMLLLLLATIAAAFGGLASFQSLSSLMRNHREVRYLVTPANYMVGMASVLLQSPPGPDGARVTIGADASQRRRPAGARPRLLVLVVGETARARNWGLNGYLRQTTPELARIQGLLNFRDVTACGSSTEVSLPCMFSRHGRTDYNEPKIRGEESLLHVLDHAGLRTLWRDNQSGCKGVCDGLEQQRMQDAADPVLCNEGRCLDEILLRDLAAQLEGERRDTVVVLHQIGNHGPAYFQRYPARFGRYLPACESVDLAHCERAQIANAYDNALLYTDHVLAGTIALLQEQQDFDAAMLYISDHGESLGENGLYLHGMPYAIAPAEQLRVPMVAWISPRFADSTRLHVSCMADRARRPASHDHLFSTVLGLLDIGTREYRPERDLFAACRQPVKGLPAQASR